MHVSRVPLRCPSIGHGSLKTGVKDGILVEKQRLDLPVEVHRGLREGIVHTHLSHFGKMKVCWELGW